MKFSIVTPVYNGERHIAETIESVLSQEGDFEIEYFIQDGDSTDGTLDTVRSYEERLVRGNYPVRCAGVTLAHASEKDGGMYDAINRGFAHATGDVYAYINADDYYLPGAFAAIAKTFEQFPDIAWLKGITSVAGTDGTQTGDCLLYNQSWIRRGIYGRNAYFIHQDSVFWKSGLWEKSGGLRGDLRYAGDYDLWIRFAAHAPLWSLNRAVSVFRKRPGQLSEDMTSYRAEQQRISSEAGLLNLLVKLFFWLSARGTLLKRLCHALYPFVFWGRNRYYVAMTDGNLALARAKSFSVPAPAA